MNIVVKFASLQERKDRGSEYFSADLAYIRNTIGTGATILKNRNGQIGAVDEMELQAEIAKNL